MLFKSQDKPLKIILLVKNILVLCLISLSSQLLAQDQKSYQLFNGVIVDKSNENIFVIHPEYGLESVSLHSGLVNWQSDSASLPLIESNAQLIAQVETKTSGKLTMAVLNSNSGELIQSRQFSLPDNISAPIADGLDRQFKFFTSYENNPNGDLLWSYRYQKGQGMLSENRPQPIKFYGVLSIDNSRTLGSMNSQILQQPHANTNKKITGNFLTNTQLNPGARQFKSINGNHILVSTLKDDPSKWNKYSWTLYDKNGKLIGNVSHSSSFSPFIVKDETIVFIRQPFKRVYKNKWLESPLSLQASSLLSGKIIWEKEIRDLKFNGPYPH